MSDADNVLPLKTRAAVRTDLRSAAEILRHGDAPNPIEAAHKIARVLEAMSQRRLDALAADMATMSGAEFDRIANTAKKAADIQLKLADFVFTKW